MTSIPSQAGDFCSHSVSSPEMGYVVPSAGATPMVPPQVALRLALARAIEGKLIGAEEAIRAMAAIEQLDESSD